MDRQAREASALSEAAIAEPALISLRGIGRSYPGADGPVEVLRGVDVDIGIGEMVAIIGASGSGKSTLMNILGCLDRASTGTYLFAGRDVSNLSPDELAELRREHFGFIFQRYQLLGDLDALENVTIPAVYAGMNAAARTTRARGLLERLGLGDRLHNRPTALSGGQQQRVSVARALMNGGEVILADEPTGALDSKSGKELMALLAELNAAGHTVIIVTHDTSVAAQARRVIEIRDGEVVADSGLGAQTSAPRLTAPEARQASRAGSVIDRSFESLRMAVRSMLSHKLRTLLTMLGIIIGIASVVSMVALGQGSQQAVLQNISSLGTDTLNIYPGTSRGDRFTARIRTLLPTDAEALATEPYVDSVSPQVQANATARVGNVAARAQIVGVGEAFFRVNARTFSDGTGFTGQSITRRAQEAVIDANAVTSLFPAGGDPLGQVVTIGKVPVRIIGVVAVTQSFGPSGGVTIYVPYTTALDRILGQNYLNQITVRVKDTADLDAAQDSITSLMQTLHGRTDFYIENTNSFREAIASSSQTLTLLISSIAVISLVVGGIGVMNIMLVSVTERTREIGVRMAVGARRADILRQFLSEAVLVCLLGGALGVAASFAFGRVLQLALPTAQLVYSPESILIALLSSSLIGIVFGFMPARSASRLDPVQALARE